MALTKHARQLLVIIAEAALEKSLVRDVKRLGAHGYTVYDVRGEGAMGVREGEWEADRTIEMKVICEAQVADQIAEHADFYSFGTNDLTQTTIGISRDDAENGFLTTYVMDGVLPKNPFETIDVEGVGAVVRIGVEKGRSVKPDLKCGVCGEHGGDPESIEFFQSVGLNYVSCSPFRVPIARFAAAKAAMGKQVNDK